MNNIISEVPREEKESIIEHIMVENEIDKALSCITFRATRQIRKLIDSVANSKIRLVRTIAGKIHVLRK